MQNNLLKSKMALHGESIKTLAEHLGISYRTCSRRLRGQTCWKQSEMQDISEILHLTDSEIRRIFVGGK